MESYLHTTIRQFLGLNSKATFRMPTMPEKLRRLLLRSEEYEQSNRDQWGNWEHPYSENYQRQTLWIPEVDIWLHEVRRQLNQENVPMSPLWPKGHQFAVCLTHDVDYISDSLTLPQRWRHCVRDANSSAPGKAMRSVKNLAKLAMKRSSLTPSTENTLQTSYAIEKELKVTSSYFFTTWPLAHYSIYDCVYHPDDRCRFLGKKGTVGDVMRQLSQEGFDVGLHGSYLSAVKEGMLSEQKAFIENVISMPVRTTRQHWLHWTPTTTPRLQAQAGLEADTTMGYNRNIGFRAGTSLPFFLYDREKQEPLPLLEVPLIIQDGALIGNNALEYTPELAFQHVKQLIDTIRNLNGCATLLFHPDIFLKPGMAPLYRRIIRYCLDNNGWVTNLNDIQQWWRGRCAALEQGCPPP